jgi:hypothetical protein
VQITKEKTLNVVNASVSAQLRTWLLQEALATIVVAEPLPPEYWLDATPRSIDE